MILLELIGVFFYVGLFSIGGGYASIPLIERQVVELHNWLSAVEFSDIVAISELVPGPVALNVSSFVGANIGGIPGSVAATAGCIAPSCLIIAVISSLYNKYKQSAVFTGALAGLQPAAAGMIAAAGLSLLITALNSAGIFKIILAGIAIEPMAAVLFALSLLLLRLKKIGPFAVMLCCGAIAAVVYFVAGLV